MRRFRSETTSDEQIKKQSRHDAFWVHKLRIHFALLCAFGLSSMMMVWVLFLPGSCVPWQKDAFLKSAGKVVPATLITKYKNNKAACYLHVLPSVLWSVLAPVHLCMLLLSSNGAPGDTGNWTVSYLQGFLSNNKYKRTYRKVHRISGYVFALVVSAMAFGYFHIIHKRNLHFHANDFPSLQKDEALSLLGPGFWPSIGCVAAFTVFEHSMCVWFFAAMCGAVVVASFRANKNARNGQSNWLPRHRAWAIRHVAAGYSVAAQRVFIIIAHAACRFRCQFFHDQSCSINLCSSPQTQKGIFADALVLGTAVCVCMGEVVIRDVNALEDEKKRE